LITFFGTIVAYQKLILHEIKGRLNSAVAYYLSVRNLLFSHLPSKRITIGICKTTIIPVVLHEFETWSLILREEHRLMVFDSRMLRRIF
jgi:hypothetical protein